MSELKPVTWSLQSMVRLSRVGKICSDIDDGSPGPFRHSRLVRDLVACGEKHHVAAIYTLRRSSMGWWPDGHLFPNGAVAIHPPATIKSLLKKGLLEGNPRGEAMALGYWDGKINNGTSHTDVVGE
jgi:hypothetical protein